MNVALDHATNRALVSAIAGHLLACDGDFIPRLSKRLVIADYAEKIVERAQRFEAWCGSELVGLVAVYCNDADTGMAFVTNVSVDARWRGNGIAMQLLGEAIAYVGSLGFASVGLEVGNLNRNAIGLYRRLGFIMIDTNATTCHMALALKNGNPHDQ